MNRRYTEEQIVKILKEAQAGARTEDLCRKYNVAINTFTGGNRSMPAWKSAMLRSCTAWKTKIEN